MPAPESIYIVHPSVANAALVPILAAATLIANNGWQLQNSGDAQYLIPTPADPNPNVITSDELTAALASLSDSYVAQEPPLITTDLNDFITAGFYTFSPNQDGDDVLNIPPPISGTVGTLTVSGGATSPAYGLGLSQTVVTVADAEPARIFVRGWDAVEQTWSAWGELTSTPVA